jgi:hypothetical protein
MKKISFIFLLLIISSFTPRKATLKIIKIVDDYRNQGVITYYGQSERRTYKIINSDTTRNMPLELGKTYDLLIVRYDTVLKFTDGMELWNPPGSGLFYNRNGAMFTIFPDDSIKGIYLLREILESE